MDSRNQNRGPALPKNHSVIINNRKQIELTGVTEVISFDPSKVVLDSVCGQIVIKGADLHVNGLSVDKGELKCDGRIDSYSYTQSAKSKGKESFMGRLLR
ncbi:MAG: sporulation protein YabP [Lachnospira sp.]